MQFIQQSSNISTQATGATAGQVFAANAARVYFQVQNVGVNPIYLLYGIGDASATNCHEILAAGATASDGAGGIARSGTVCYQGRIAVGGTAPTYIAYQIAP